MSTTVTYELWVQPGHEDAILQMAAEQFSPSGQVVEGRHYARLYQHLDDSTRLLYVAEWESEAAFNAYRATEPYPSHREQLQSVPSIRFYRRLANFERVSLRADLACVCFVSGPPEQHDAIREAALQLHHGAARREPGLVSLVTSERDEQPASLVIASEWQRGSPVGSQHHIQDAHAPDEQLLAPLLAAGATLDRFVARHLLDADWHIPGR